MKKQLLQTFMSKYCFKEHSNADIESVIWEVSGNVMTVKAMPSDRSILIKSSLTCDDLKILDGYSLGVNRTTQFIKLLNILDEDIKLKLNATEKAAISLEMKDSSTNVKYAFGDTRIIHKVPTKQNIPDAYELSLDIDIEFINKFIKAKSAIPDMYQFAIETNDDGCFIVMGNTDVNSNVISFKVGGAKYNENIPKMKFDGFYLKQILNANKDCDGTIEVSTKGLMIVSFKTKEFISEYYLLRL